MITLFVLSVLLTAGLAIGHQGLPSVSPPAVQDAHHSSGPAHIAPRSIHSPMHQKRSINHLHKRETCNNESCLLPRKQVSPPSSPSPPRNRNNNNNDNNGLRLGSLAIQRNTQPGNTAPQTNPNAPPNRTPTPPPMLVPIPRNPPTASHSTPDLRPWRGSPSAPPLPASLPTLPPERPHPVEMRLAAVEESMRGPHNPVLFGTPSSSFRTWHSRGH